MKEVLSYNKPLKIENLLASEVVEVDDQEKVDEFSVTAIDSSTKLFQGEALLKTLQDRIAMIHKFDAEIELLIKNEDELASELEQQTEFHVSASLTIARLSSLIENYKKRDRPPHEFSTDPSSSNSATSSRMKLPKLQLPAFTGSYTDWMSFSTYSRPLSLLIPIFPIQKS